MTHFRSVSRVLAFAFSVVLALGLPVAQAAGWEYGSRVDKMTSAETPSAKVMSDNTIELAFPYSGGTYAQLSVRRRPSESVNVIFGVSKGQLICHSYNCDVSVRFDNAPPVRFSGTEPADNDTKMLFVNSEARFVAAAKKAKKILVQVTFFQGGSQVFEFSTPEPLVWPPKSTGKL